MTETNCSTCGRDYVKGEATYCSNAFHCCRDCEWVAGRRMMLCAEHAPPPSVEVPFDQIKVGEFFNWRDPAGSGRYQGAYWRQLERVEPRNNTSVQDGPEGFGVYAVPGNVRAMNGGYFHFDPTDMVVKI